MRDSALRRGVIRYMALQSLFDLVLPGRRLVFVSPLGVGEVRKRLERQVSKPGIRLWDQRTEMFEGTFANDRFEIARLVRGRNSFRPMIHGRLSMDAAGTRIDARMQLHPVVMVVYGLMVFIAGTAAALAAPAVPMPPLAARILVMALLFLAVSLVANLEARKATRLLAQLFASEPLHYHALSDGRLSRLS